MLLLLLPLIFHYYARLFTRCRFILRHTACCRYAASRGMSRYHMLTRLRALIYASYYYAADIRCRFDIR